MLRGIFELFYMKKRCEFFKIGYMQDVKYVFIVQKERSFRFN